MRLRWFNASQKKPKTTPKAQRLSGAIARHVSLWRSAWRDERHEQAHTPAQGKELEFLPAVLEIQESPPSPAGRAIAFTVIATFTAAILWACFGKIDILAIAQGKIIPSDYTKLIQPLEAGVIKAIYVRDGQTVKRGEALLDLDTTLSQADTEGFHHERLFAAVQMRRLHALLAGKDTLIDLPAGAQHEFVTLQGEMLRDQLAEYRGRVAVARLLIAQRQAALDVTLANIERLEATLPLLTERADAYKKLSAQKYGERLQYLEIEQQRIDKLQELAGQRHQLIENQAALAEAKKQEQVLQSEFRGTQQKELTALETQTAALAQELIKAEQRTRQERLIAPIDGVVQQLVVHTVGGVVTPAQQLMTIVPHEHPVVVEAWVLNKDIGFVLPRQAAEVKVDAFPFTRYGTLDARVVTLSHDAIPQEKGGLLYAARVKLKRSTLLIDGKQVSLAPGMTVSVEIKTGKRRVIEYFLSPLLQAGHESIRER